MNNRRIPLGEVVLEKACQTNVVEAGRPTQQMGPLWKASGQRRSIRPDLLVQCARLDPVIDVQETQLCSAQNPHRLFL